MSSLSLNAFAAGNFGYLPTTDASQKEVQSDLNGGNYKRALSTWAGAYGTTSFAQSSNGSATYAYLLYQNGLPYTGFETLMQTAQPATLDPQLLRLWKTEMKNSALIQKGWIQTQGGWKALFNNESVVVPMKTKADIAKAFARAGSVPSDNINEKARILWQIATRAPSIDAVDSALQAVKLLRESGQSIIGQDQLAMTQGRLLYQKGELAAALNAYQQIPKSSNLWLEGVEERAWAHLRQDDYDRALGDVTTAESPALVALAGPETYFLAHLLAYRVCDYTRLFENSENFKARHRARLTELQSLAQKGTNSKINQVFERFEQRGVSQEVAGADVEFMPRQMFRDTQFIRAMESRRQLLGEIKKATELNADGKSSGLNRSITAERTLADTFKQIAFQRARTLAQMDLKEYRMVLNKMNIIEGEVIQRMHLDDNLKGQRSKLTKADDSGDVLVFPYTKEVWMDELDNYKAQVKDCPTMKGASL